MDSSVFSLKKQNEEIVKNSLKHFEKSSLSEFSIEKAKEAQKLFQKISQSGSSVSFFVFGGMGGSSYLFDSFSSYKKHPHKKFYKIDRVDQQSVSHLLKKTKTELKKSHFVFISKSGRTPELLFYIKLLKNIYSKNQISLKNKVTVLISDMKSPLAQFARKEQADIISLQEDLPGRFSIFTLSGFLQMYFQGLNPLDRFSDPVSKLPGQIRDFLFQQRNKKEYWLCSSCQPFENFGVWIDLVWSESLLKDHKKNLFIPALKHLNLYKLQHAYIEEMIAKQKEIAVLFFDLKIQTSKKTLEKKESLFFKHSDTLKDFLNFQDKNRKKTQNLIRSKNIPLLTLEMDSSESSLFDLVFSFYQVLFLFGDFFKVDLFKNEQVDQLKRRV